MKPTTTTRLRAAGVVFTILVSAGLGLSGLGGCGGGGGATRGASGSGVSISSPSDIPSLNIGDYDFVGTDSSADMSALKASRHGNLGLRLRSAFKNQAAGGEFSQAFCNQKQCLIETLRQALDIEADLCFLRTISEARGITFENDNAFHYFSFDMEDPEFGAAAILVRLKRNGDEFKMQVCEEGTFFEELVINQTTLNSLDGINATVTHDENDPFTGERFQGQFSVQANCAPAAFFTDASCVFSADSRFVDPFGQGNINFSASGGTSVTEILHNLEANFAAGSIEEGATAFNVLLKSQWGAGSSATGASNVDLGDGGTYPPITAADLTGGNANDPILSICPPADLYCFNPNFDPEDPASCPVAPFTGTAGCPIPVDWAKFTECYSITGTALVDQAGFVLDCADPTVQTHFDAVQTASTLSKEVTISFSESWNCSDDGNVTELDLTGVDLAECFDLLADSQDSLSEESCFEQDAVDDAGDNAYCDADDDGDGVGNCDDNCPWTSNADQADADGDFQGDACASDFDGDGVLDTVDNCTFDANANQADSDGNGVGDVCDIGNMDFDGDGWSDDHDNCLFDANADQADADSDFLGDVCDPCPADATDSCFF